MKRPLRTSNGGEKREKGIILGLRRRKTGPSETRKETIEGRHSRMKGGWNQKGGQEAGGGGSARPRTQKSGKTPKLPM